VVSPLQWTSVTENRLKSQTDTDRFNKSMNLQWMAINAPHSRAIPPLFQVTWTFLYLMEEIEHNCHV